MFNTVASIIPALKHMHNIVHSIHLGAAYMSRDLKAGLVLSEPLTVMLAPEHIQQLLIADLR
jgi:hypothetical protein